MNIQNLRPAPSVAVSRDAHDPAAEADARIAWILDHPGMSGWLKSSLRGALHRHPISVLNDLEVLRSVIEHRLATSAVIDAPRNS